MAGKHIVCWVWLAFGVFTLVYGAWTGGGLAGWLFYWELQKFGAVFSLTYLVLALFLVVPPGVVLAGDADRRRPRQIDLVASARRSSRRLLVCGAVLIAIAGLCYWRTTLLPAPDDPPSRLVLDSLPPLTPVAESKAILVGTPQRAYGVRYGEVLSGRFGLSSTRNHNLVPVTPSSWTPDQPVHFLVDTRGNSVSSVFPRDTDSRGLTSDPGLLLRDQLPVYVRRALTAKGLQIAADVMVLSSDREFGRIPWLVSASFCAIGAFALVLVGLVWPWAVCKSEREREALLPRVARYIAWSIGGVLILLGIIVAVPKLAHVASAPRTDGVITSVWEHHHTVARYTYTVDYATPAGHFREMTVLGTPFPWNKGDHVRILYGPNRSGRPELLAFDEDWVVVLIFLTPGAAIAIAGAWLFRSKPAR